MKRRIALYFVAFFLFGFLFVADIVTAQTTAYRQANLASNLPNVASSISRELVNPWGMAFLSGQPFFIADNKVGRVTSHDAKGSGVGPGGFTTPNAAGTGSDTPAGIVADQNSFFDGPSLVKPFILVTNQGTVFSWGTARSGRPPIRGHIGRWSPPSLELFLTRQSSESQFSSMQSVGTTSMIEPFLYWAWIGGQALYWLFVKYQTEILDQECWRMCLLR